MEQYEARLIAVGYRPCCAHAIVEDYKRADKLAALEAYLSAKEHVEEVLG